MVRLTRLAVAALALSPAPSLASVAAFDAEASATMTLISAEFAAAPGDAYGFLSLTTVEDAEDSVLTLTNAVGGNGGAFVQDWIFDNVAAPGLGFELSSRVTGGADAPSPFGPPDASGSAAQYAYPAFFYDDAFCAGFCDAVSSIELTFGYDLAAMAEASLAGPAGRAASADATVSIAFGVTATNSAGLPLAFAETTAGAAASRSDGAPFAARDSDAATGIVELSLRPGETAYADVYIVRASGSALVDAPAPIPLPAGLPLLGAALGVLALGARRRR